MCLMRPLRPSLFLDATSARDVRTSRSKQQCAARRTTGIARCGFLRQWALRSRMQRKNGVFFRVAWFSDAGSLVGCETSPVGFRGSSCGFEALCVPIYEGCALACSCSHSASVGNNALSPPPKVKLFAMWMLPLSTRRSGEHRGLFQLDSE